jgi:hypothetical protein
MSKGYTQSELAKMATKGLQDEKQKTLKDFWNSFGAKVGEAASKGDPGIKIKIADFPSTPLLVNLLLGEGFKVVKSSDSVWFEWGFQETAYVPL